MSSANVTFSLADLASSFAEKFDIEIDLVKSFLQKQLMKAPVSLASSDEPKETTKSENSKKSDSESKSKKKASKAEPSFILADGGCNYKILRGDDKGKFCNAPVVDGTERCKACSKKGAAKKEAAASPTSTSSSSATKAAKPKKPELTFHDIGDGYAVCKGVPGLVDVIVLESNGSHEVVGYQKGASAWDNISEGNLSKNVALTSEQVTLANSYRLVVTGKNRIGDVEKIQKKYSDKEYNLDF